MIATRLMTSAPASLAAAILLAAPFSGAFAQQASPDAAAPASPHTFTANVSVVS
ncbi:MAG: hypothetical protein INH07_20920, partial [Cupriavidus sp.]|nr:hypothetical protein [Cupriavidus sp.]